MDLTFVTLGSLRGDSFLESHMVHSPLIPVISICPLKVDLHVLAQQILEFFFYRFLADKHKYMSLGLILIQKLPLFF